MSVRNRVLAMSAKPKQTKAPTPVAKAPKQKTLTKAQLAEIAAISGKDEADRIEALLAGGAMPSAVVEHLKDQTLSQEAQLALVAEFLHPKPKLSVSELADDIAQQALTGPLKGLA